MTYVPPPARPAAYAPSGDPYDAVKDESHDFEIDGLRVVLTRFPIHRQSLDSLYTNRRYGPGRVELGHPGEQRRYEVRVDGDHVGWAVRRFGGGRQPYEGLALFEGYMHGMGEHGHPELSGRPRDRHRNASFELVDIARRFAKWRKDRVALTWNEIVARNRREIAKAEREEREAEASRVADRVKHKRELREREEQRADAVDGLREIDARFGSELTNYQAEALRRAIARMEGDALHQVQREFIDSED